MEKTGKNGVTGGMAGKATATARIHRNTEKVEIVLFEKGSGRITSFLRMPSSPCWWTSSRRTPAGPRTASSRTATAWATCTASTRKLPASRLAFRGRRREPWIHGQSRQHGHVRPEHRLQLRPGYHPVAPPYGTAYYRNADGHFRWEDFVALDEA